MRPLILTLVCALGLIAQAAPASAAEAAQPYGLEKDSEFQYGCFGPCACPILVTSGLDGGFNLSPRGPSGLFFEYDVLDVRWLIPAYGDSIPVTGYGTYRIGGEFAHQEQLVLNLQVGGQPPRVYDSGVVAKANEFPAIDLEIASSGFFCIDTVFAVHATPRDVTGATGPSATGFGIVAVRPNPTLSGAAIEFVTSQAGLVDLIVLDARGRRMAGVLESAWMEAGPHHASWSGLAERGTPLPPGVYWIELRENRQRNGSRVIKLSTGGAGRIPFSPR